MNEIFSATLGLTVARRLLLMSKRFDENWNDANVIKRKGNATETNAVSPLFSPCYFNALLQLRARRKLPGDRPTQLAIMPKLPASIFTWPK